MFLLRIVSFALYGLFFLGYIAAKLLLDYLIEKHVCPLIHLFVRNTLEKRDFASKLLCEAVIELWSISFNQRLMGKVICQVRIIRIIDRAFEALPLGAVRRVFALRLGNHLLLLFHSISMQHSRWYDSQG